MNIPIKQYVAALFEVANEQKATDRVIANLAAIERDSNLIQNILKNPQFTQSQKKELLEKANLNDLAINFVLILSQQNKLGILKNIVLGLKQLRNEQINTIEVRAEIAQPLDKGRLADLKRALEQKFKKNILLETELKPDLLGGITLNVDEYLIDNSLKNKLNLLRKELIK